MASLLIWPIVILLWYFIIDVEGETRPLPRLPIGISSLTQAGFKKSSLSETAQICLQPPERNIQTPDEISKYRKSFKEQCGVTIVALPTRSITTALPMTHCHRTTSPTALPLRNRREWGTSCEQETRKEWVISWSSSDKVNTTRSSGSPWPRPSIAVTFCHPKLRIQISSTESPQSWTNMESRTRSTQGKTCLSHRKWGNSIWNLTRTTILGSKNSAPITGQWIQLTSGSEK